ncbi:serine hydrolase [Sphingomonas sp. HF-S3]|uniref:Serine hydrolase n=1 Tax=Sphingomonas rustica TaxID=3103142 RepID=A0ABV0BA35_9SPHN
MIARRTRSVLGLAAAALAWSSPGVAAAQDGRLIAGADDLGTAVSAQIACAGIFVSGRTQANVLREDILGYAPFTRAITLTVDRKAGTVTASAPGARTRTALYRPQVGCTLLTGTVARPTLLRQAAGLRPMRSQAAKPWPMGDAPARPDTVRRSRPIDRAALDKAVEGAFTEQNKDGLPDTRAILVVQGGEIVAERYAPGFDRNTRLLGWSASKSIAATLIGLLVDDGVLKLDAPAPIPEWQKPGDPRGRITLRQLLTMTSGLKFEESYVPGTDSIRMLFEASDMAAVAAALPLAKAPGTEWSYSSGTTNMLSAIVFRATGGTLAGMNRYARTRLFEPAGMTGMLIEPDEAGVMVGSSYAYGTARDWARFGLLYLNGGRAGGRQILSDAWVDIVRTPVAAAPRPVYSAQFWLNRGDETGPAARLFPGLPADAIMARGHNFQVVAAIPSLDAVIVRLGWTPEGQRFDVNTHFSRIAAALPPAVAR